MPDKIRDHRHRACTGGQYLFQMFQSDASNGNNRPLHPSADGGKTLQPENRGVVLFSGAFENGANGDVVDRFISGGQGLGRVVGGNADDTIVIEDAPRPRRGKILMTQMDTRGPLKSLQCRLDH